MKRYAGVFLVLFLSGCATSQDGGDVTGGNPAEHCKRQGFQENSDEYKSCVSAYVDEYCRNQDLEPGTNEYKKCIDSLHEATFLRQQMQIRGF